MKTVLFLCVVALIMLSTIAHADLPLTVEDLITDKGKIKIDLSLSYVNQDFQDVAIDKPVDVLTGTSTVTLPSEIGDFRGNSDIVVGTLGLRYGLSDRLELHSRASWAYGSSRISFLGEIDNESEEDFLSAWVGLNYEFKKDGDTSGFLGFAEVTLREKYPKNSVSFKSYMLGTTIYHAIDPIVFSLTSSYLLNQVRQLGDEHGDAYKPGNVLTVNPSVAFATNDRITLTTGFRWANRQPNTFNGKTEDFRHTITDLLLGVGYGVSKGSIASVTFFGNVSGRNGADLRLNWLYTL